MGPHSQSERTSWGTHKQQLHNHILMPSNHTEKKGKSPFLGPIQGYHPFAANTGLILLRISQIFAIPTATNK